jgi:hypothetical protein
VVADLVRHGAQQEALGAGHALVADDDQVGIGLLGDVEDRVGRVPLTRVRLGRDALLARHLDGLAQRRVDVLTRVDHPLQVGRRLVGLLAQALPRHRLVGADDLELRVEARGEVDRLPNRLGGGVRPVRSDDDRAEHVAPSWS